MKKPLPVGRWQDGIQDHGRQGANLVAADRSMRTPRSFLGAGGGGTTWRLRGGSGLTSATICGSGHNCRRTALMASENVTAALPR